MAVTPVQQMRYVLMYQDLSSVNVKLATQEMGSSALVGIIS